MRKITTCLLSAALFFAGSLACHAVPIADLSEISDLDGSYELTADAVLSDDFTPIGSADAPFTGKFDGGGHTVSISGKAGLFGATENAEISGVSVVGTASGNAVIGGIAASAKGTVIENCTFDGYLTPDVSGFTVYAGGIAGTTDKKTVIRNCKATVKATLADTAYLTYIGGIAGLNRGSITSCTVSGKLSADVSLYRLTVGGVAGENRGDVTGCFNTASISGTAAVEGISIFAGGIAGCNTGSLCRVENGGTVMTSGKSIYPGYAGGIAGANVNGKITLAKNSGNVSAEAAFIGGSVGLNLGYKAGASLDNTLNTGALTGTNSVIGGIAANNTKTAHEESDAKISSSLNISEAAGIGKNTANLSDIYSTGKNDGLSTSVSEAALRKNGVPALEGAAEEWVSNTDISALPDLLIVRDENTPELIASTGAADKRAYYLYTPTGGTDARAFYAVYYDGTRYLSSSAVTAEPQNGFTKLTASNIPENATKIRFIAFESALSDGIHPASVAAAEISLVEQEKDASILEGKNIVCIGDSLTEGDYGSNPAGTMNVHAENYPYFLAEITGANVKNAGRCGYSAELYYNNQLSKVELSEETDIVLIMLGTNNGLTDSIDADTSATHYSSYAKTQTGYYARIIETCMERTNGRAQIILMTPPVTTQRNRTSLETTVSVIKKFGEKYGLPVIDNYYACGITYENIGGYMPIDELHCGYTGYKLLANYIASRTADIYKDFKPESYALNYKIISEPVGYMGRWFDKDVNGVTCKATFSQGAELYFKVSGTSKVWLKLHSTASPAPVLAVSVDGSAPKRITTVKEGSLLIAENLSESEHTFRIIVDGFNEYQEKWTSAMGFVLECPEVENGGTITGLLPTNPVILYYGDSITEGINVLGTGSTPDSNSASNEYPFIASHLLNAVSYTNGFGASGVTRGGSGGVPKCLDVIDTLYNGMPLSETPAPAAIVINHGHNDPTSDSAAFTEAYTAVLKRLREKYPNTPIFAVSPFAGMHNADIKAVVEDLGDSNIFFIAKPSFSYTTSDGAHPDKNGAKALGTYLAKEIAAKTNLAANAKTSTANTSDKENEGIDMTKISSHEKIALWESGNIPYDKGADTLQATIRAYLADGADSAVVIFPGGGYFQLSDDSEGVAVAKAYNQKGISAFVVNYRYKPYDGNAILADGIRSVQFVRRYAKDFGIDPEKIAVCGFSAGGHLAMLVCEKADTFVSPVSDSISAYNAHPNACILGYPVVTLGDGTYPTMPEIFLGDKKDDETEIAKYSYPYNLSDMPATFAFYGEKDTAVDYSKNAEAITAALKAAGKTAECHAFSDAGHGIGLGESYADYSRWFDLSVTFLQNALNA